MSGRVVIAPDLDLCTRYTQLKPDLGEIQRGIWKLRIYPFLHRKPALETEVCLGTRGNGERRTPQPVVRQRLVGTLWVLRLLSHTRARGPTVRLTRFFDEHGRIRSPRCRVRAGPATMASARSWRLGQGSSAGKSSTTSNQAARSTPATTIQRAIAHCCTSGAGTSDS